MPWAGAAPRGSILAAPSTKIGMHCQVPSEAAPKEEKKQKRMDEGFLEPPRWKHKESKDWRKEEKKTDKLNRLKEKKEKKKKS